MAVPFPEAQIEPLIYMALGSLLTAVIMLGIYIRRLHREMNDEKEKKLEVDKIGLSARSQELLETVIQEPELQSDLPDKLKVSKATVSNSVTELKDRNFIKRKKRGNSYLIEPKIEVIEEEVD